MESVSQTELVARVRERADMENSNFVSDNEIVDLLNDQIDRLYNDMTNIDDGKLFAVPAQTLVQIGDNAYQLPSDFMRLVDVNIYTGSRWYPSMPADPQEYYQLLTRNYTGDYDSYYFLRLNPEAGRYELFVFPSKDPSRIGVRYIPTHPTLSSASDTLKWPASWHKAVIDGTAAQLLIKEESDPTAMIREYEMTRERILRDIRRQSVAEIKTLRDMGRRNRRRSSYLWSWYG